MLKEQTPLPPDPNYRLARLGEPTPFGGSTPLTGNGHSLNTIDDPVPPALRQGVHAVFFEISESKRLLHVHAASSKCRHGHGLNVDLR